MGNGGAYEGCTTPMKDVNKGFAVITTKNIDAESFRDEELLEIINGESLQDP